MIAHNKTNNTRVTMECFSSEYNNSGVEKYQYFALRIKARWEYRDAAYA